MVPLNLFIVSVLQSRPLFATTTKSNLIYVGIIIKIPCLRSFLHIHAFFQLRFLAFLERTCILFYVVYERLKFLVFKIDKIASKNLNQGERRQFENEEFETFEKIFPSYFKHFFRYFLYFCSAFFVIAKSCYCLTRFCREM